jgi:hypothetical protein
VDWMAIEQNPVHVKDKSDAHAPSKILADSTEPTDKSRESRHPEGTPESDRQTSGLSDTLHPIADHT